MDVTVTTGLAEPSVPQAYDRNYKLQVRIIVRPWIPRNLPYSIPSDSVEQILQNVYPSLKKVLYVGWVKRRVDNKMKLFYLAATGDTTRQARENFKKSEAFGENIWELGGRSL